MILWKLTKICTFIVRIQMEVKVFHFVRTIEPKNIGTFAITDHDSIERIKDACVFMI